MNMYSDWLLVMWSLVLVSLLLCKSSWTLVCHREEQFVKVEGMMETFLPFDVSAFVTMFRKAFFHLMPGCLL